MRIYFIVFLYGLISCGCTGRGIVSQKEGWVSMPPIIAPDGSIDRRVITVGTSIAVSIVVIIKTLSGRTT